ncbi:adenylate/guanylate cyclase domain-containing protein [Cesiribacter sp. SM1]|uniref:adenylate/guanylate cyclase domain-containing protein n=1 Tax=Cesiribacter sp. SM1 TaxID=2861196 RepID=UPI001CD1F3B5|nr:adenylate/guanylate cyclase domain-containing protein [Cesiribacter sp. SM1]
MENKQEFNIGFCGEQQVKILKGQTILKASLAAGIQHYHVCGGRGNCSTCRVLIYQGTEFLSPPTRRELELRKIMQFPEGIRLACQTRVLGEPVTMHRIIRDDGDVGLYISEEERDEIKEIGRERELALFFLDIRNFTFFMSKQLPFDVMHILRRLFKLFRKNVEEDYDGKILETGGDSLYAVFGIQGNLHNATQAAVDAGMAILKDVEIFNEKYLKVFFDHYIEVGMGLHVGKVIIGNRGLGLNNNLAAMGPPVNVAARLQNATKQLNNSFVVSEEAYKLLKARPADAAIATVRLKDLVKQQTVRLLGKAYAQLV